MSKQCIITIARQFGSGGHEIGEKLAKQLNISFYDSNLLTQAAKDSGIDLERFEDADERPGDRYLYYNPITSQNLDEDYMKTSKFLSDDDVTQAQFTTIRKIANSGESCVIIGRCADHVLYGYENKLSVFIYADLETRISRVMEQQHVTERDAKKLIRKIDKVRSSYYNYFTDKEWGDIENYDLCINVTKLGIDKAAEAIINFPK